MPAWQPRSPSVSSSRPRSARLEFSSSSDKHSKFGARSARFAALLLGGLGQVGDASQPTDRYLMANRWILAHSIEYHCITSFLFNSFC